MKYVLDASVAIKWILPELDSPKALAIREDFRNQIHELIAPDTFPIEVAHSLTRAERRGILQQFSALNKVAEVLATGIELHPYLDLLPRAIEIASTARIGVYDCVYVALAEQAGCDLLTADEKLIKNLPGSPIISLGAI